MVDIQTVSIAIASTGVFVAAIYYILQIRAPALGPSLIQPIKKNNS